jgi:hypothetical protein
MDSAGGPAVAAASVASAAIRSPSGSTISSGIRDGSGIGGGNLSSTGEGIGHWGSAASSASGIQRDVCWFGADPTGMSGRDRDPTFSSAAVAVVCLFGDRNCSETACNCSSTPRRLRSNLSDWSLSEAIRVRMITSNTKAARSSKPTTLNLPRRIDRELCSLESRLDPYNSFLRLIEITI